MDKNEELISAVLDGDKESYGDLVVPYIDRLHAISFSYVGDVQLAEDVTQDALIKAYTALRTLAKPKSFGSWLQKITRNLSLSALRRRKGNEVRLEDSDDQATPREKDPSEASHASDVAEILQEALSQMSPKIRETMVLFYFKEQSIPEIASFSDISENTVKQRLHRGRMLLRGRLEKVALDEGRKDVTLSEQFLPGVMIALPVQPAEPTLLGGVLGKLAAIPLLGTLATSLIVAGVSSGAASWLLASEIDPSNEAARRSMRRTALLSIIFVVCLIALVFWLFSLPDDPPYNYLKWSSLGLPVALLAFYYLRAGATWRMKLTFVGLLVTAICVGCMFAFPDWMPWLLGIVLLLMAAMQYLESTWLPSHSALRRDKTSPTEVPSEIEPSSVEFLHGNADKFLKILNTPTPILHHISKEADHVCFSAHSPFVTRLIYRLAKWTESWKLPWCRFGSARLYPDGAVEYEAGQRDSFPEHWGPVEEEEERVRGYISDSWANFVTGNEEEALSVVPDFFPENIYVHKKGRTTLTLVTYVVIFLLVYGAVKIFWLN